MDIYPGQIVSSRAGRDRGKYFIVMEIIDSQYVYLCDGDMRRIENPKKKKKKHLISVERYSDHIKDKLENRQKMTNAEIRRCLAAEVAKLEQ